MLGSNNSGSQARDRTRCAGHTRQATAQAGPQRKGRTSDVVFLDFEIRAPMMTDQLPRMMRADSPPNARLMVQRTASIMDPPIPGPGILPTPTVWVNDGSSNPSDSAG
jgi:hypothetical protein